MSDVPPEDQWGRYWGGAMSPNWGPIRVHAWIGLAAGRHWTLGPHPQARFDAGNTLAQLPQGATPQPDADPSGTDTPRIWVDVSCDVVAATITTGATSADGVIARAEAGTCEITLADPDRRWDPLNPQSPWRYQGGTRLTPGAPVLVWVEYLSEGMFINRQTLFIGSVESWRTPWTPTASERRSTVVATDAVTDLVHAELPESDTPAGDGDTTDERVARILDRYHGPNLLSEPSTVTLQPTTFAGDPWAQLQAVADAEIGFIHVTPYHASPLDSWTREALVGIRFLPRSVWTEDVPTNFITCLMMTAANVTALSSEIRNRIVATREGGATVTVENRQSIDRYGLRSFTATGLPHATDAETAAWANFLLSMYAYPRPTLTDVTLVPGKVPEGWTQTLTVTPITEGVEIEWTPPDSTDVYTVLARVAGATHRITRDRWELRWTLAAAHITARTWTLGPDDQAHFDAGNTLGFATTA